MTRHDDKLDETDVDPAKSPDTMRWRDADRNGAKRYRGRICPFHEELNGLRRTRNGQCVGCHADRAWYVSQKWHQELHAKLKEMTAEDPDAGEDDWMCLED